MKLPFKLKLPFGKKGDDDDEYDEDFDDEAPEDDSADPDELVQSGGGGAGGGDGDDGDDGDEDYDEDEDEDEEGGGLSRERILLIAGIALGVAVLGGGGVAGWMFMGGDDSEDVQVVSLKIPPSGAAPGGGMLSPPPEGQGQGQGQGLAAGSLNAVAAAATGPGAGLVVAAVDQAAFAGAPEMAPAEALSDVPDMALIEQGPHGPLPKVGADGRMPWQAYARPVAPGEDRPRIAVIITGLGLSRAATEAAINRLPGAVTLAFDPYAKGLDDWVPLARKAGHEILLCLPLEPRNFPTNDAGPLALLSELKPAENLERLNFVLSRLSGYVGLISVMGSKFNTTEDRVRPILASMKQRGLMLVESSIAGKSLAPKIATEIGLPRALNNVILDANPSKAAIDAQLAALERIANEQAVAVAIGSPYPSTLTRLAAWAATLDAKNLVLAPVSALADKQFLQ